jgi:GNAT superfamily N-acetyltransferase
LSDLPDLELRPGTTADLQATFSLAQYAMYDAGRRAGVIPPDQRELTDADVRADWLRQRSFVEFLAAQPEGCYTIAESGGEMIAFARNVRLGDREQLSELMVDPRHQGKGVGRLLLEQCWPTSPTVELGRIVIAAGAQSDLTLYTNFGVMPIAGHWHMRQRTESYLAHRSQEDQTESGVHVLKPERAVEEWGRLEPRAIGHSRHELHEFFARDRTCLGSLGPAGEAAAVCWVSSEGEIGPAVANEPGDLVPVIITALDRVAMTVEPAFLSVYTTTLSWWLLRRLRALGFQVYWPSWVMCSIPLPGLDRYMPTRPPHLL